MCGGGTMLEAGYRGKQWLEYAGDRKRNNNFCLVNILHSL